MKTILTNCTVIDCTGEPSQKNVTVVVEGEKIAGLKPDAYSRAAGEGGRVFDLEGGYVLPGLWDVHAHLFDLTALYPMSATSALSRDIIHLLFSESVADCTIRCGRNAMDALRWGVTGMRLAAR